MWRQLSLFLTMYSSSVMAAETQLQFYRPFTDTNKHIIPKADISLEGKCLKQSELIAREDAWQCEAQGKIYDPCFVKPYGHMNEAICPESPWVAESVRINVSSSVDNTTHKTLDMSRNYPWAVELESGVKCQAFLSKVASYDGLPVRYFCSDKSSLLGHLQRCSSSWKILQHTERPELNTVAIEKAWF